MAEMHPINVSAGGKHKFLRVKPAELDAWIARRVKEPERVEPVIVMPKPKRRQSTTVMFPQPINGRIPTRKEAREQMRALGLAERATEGGAT
jgi:hypothetical protein